MNYPVLFLTLFTVFALICGLPTDNVKNTLNEDCPEGGSKDSCDGGKFVSNTELKSQIKNNLNKIGVSMKSLQRRNQNQGDTNDIQNTIDVLNDIKRQVQVAYKGALKEGQKRKKNMTPAQCEMLDIYIQQLKMSTDYSIKKIDECVQQLMDEKNGVQKGSYSRGGGVSETVGPALVNFMNQYNDIYEYMSD